MTITVLGLVAVFLAALEHEDLIFAELDAVQRESRSGTTCPAGESDGSGAVGMIDSATGTESMFLPESHALGVGERECIRIAILPPAASRPQWAGVGAATLRARFAPQAGTVNLLL